MSDNAKILIVGAPGAGKTSLLKRYDEDAFDDGDVSYDKEFLSCEIDAHGAKVPLEFYHDATEADIGEKSNVVGIIFVFDVTSQDSFDALAPLVEAMNTKLKESLSAAICCNKVEDDNTEERVVTFMACKDVYSAQIPVFETSGKTGKNVKTVINNMKMLCVEDIPAPPEPEGKKKKEGGGKKKGGCALC